MIRFAYQPLLRRVSHGPAHWPFWKLFSLSYLRLDNSYLRPEIIAKEGRYVGHRLWIYTRSGGRYVEIYQITNDDYVKDWGNA